MVRKIVDIRKQLVDISSHILACATALEGTFGAPDHKYKSELRELIRRIDALSKDIAAHQSMTRSQSWAFKHGSDARWKARQQEKEVDALSELATAQIKFALTLLDTEPKDSMKKGKDLIKLGEEIDKAVAQYKAPSFIATSEAPAYVPPSKPDSGLFESTFAFVVTFSLFAKWCVDHWAKKQE